MNIQTDEFGVFAPVIQAIRRGRDIDRMDMVCVNQTMLAINQATEPMSFAVSGLIEKCVSAPVRRTLRNLAKAQDSSQSLPYHNAVQATKEMISFLLICGLEMSEARRGVSDDDLIPMLDEGILALGIRYFGAAKIDRTVILDGGGLAELSYYDHALAAGLLADLPEGLRYRVWDAVIQGRPLNRMLPGYLSEPLLYRNLSDAVILPFVGISYELNMSDRTRIRVQNELSMGELVQYHQDHSDMVLPKGSIRGSSYETFIRRMITSGHAFRIKTGSVSGLLR